MKNKFIVPVLLTGLSLVNIATADIYFNGFSSIVAGKTLSNNDELYQYHDKLNFKNESLFALQATGDVGDGLSVTAQILSRGKDDWKPRFEWAYIGYNASDQLRFLVGRQRAPFYMYSDFLDVSYAYPWITPPAGVYDLIFDTFDGVAVLYTTALGEFDTNIHVIYGDNTDELTAFSEEVSPDFKNLVGGSVSFNKDWFTFRMAYFSAEMNVPFQQLQPLILGWQQAGFNTIADRIKIENDRGTFAEVGVQFDYNNYLLIAEYTQLSLDDTPLVEQDSYYIMLGKQMGDVLIHFTYGADDNDKADITASVVNNSALAALVNNTRALVNSQKSDSNYITLGAKWDFHESASLKIEYTDFKEDLNSTYNATLLRMALVTVF